MKEYAILQYDWNIEHNKTDNLKIHSFEDSYEQAICEVMAFYTEYPLIRKYYNSEDDEWKFIFCDEQNDPQIEVKIEKLNGGIK